MNALVVGGAGFLGANLVRTLLRDGAHQVTVLDSLEPKLRASADTLREVRDRIRFIHGDMRDAAVCADAVARQDVIFQCAGQTSHPISMKEPMFDASINCIGNLTLLEAVRQHNRDAVVVYTSTSTVVGKGVRTPIDEDHPELPLDIYSSNKLAAEKYYRIYHHVHGLKTVALRFANLFGPFGKGYPEFGFVNYFIHLGWTGEEIKIFGTGEQLRNPLYVADACDAMLRAAQEPSLRGTHAFAAHDDQHSVREIAEAIVTTFGRGKVTHIEWPEERKRIEVDDVKISSAKLRAATGWRPTFSLREGLEATREALR